MYWYLEKERPVDQIREIRRIEANGEFAKLTREKQETIIRQLWAWQAAQARYLYDPNPKELSYFLQPHKTKAISGGNRSGKTATNCVDIVMRAEGWHPLQRNNLETLSENAFDPKVRDHCKKLLDNKQWIKNPKQAIRVVAIDYSNYVENIIGPEIEKWATKSMLDDIAYANQNKRIITWKKDSEAKGSFVEFLTHGMPLKAHGGAARDTIYVDEELEENYWAENAMRTISNRGKMLYGATAIEGVSWTEEKIFVPAEKGSDKVFMIEMATDENPTITQEAIDEVLDLCVDQTDIDIRLKGKRVRKGGNVYKMARDEAPWVIERFEIPKDKGVLILALDPHPQMEHSGMWWWIDYDGLFHPLIKGMPNCYEVAEFFENGTIESIKYFIEMGEMQIGRKHDFFLADPWIWNTEQLRPEEKCVADQLMDLGLYPMKGSKDRTANTLRIGHLLSLTHEKVTDEEKVTSLVNPSAVLNKYPDAHPRLMLFSDLTRTRFERRNWHYPTYKGMAVREHDKIKNKPVDKDDHMMENEGRVGAFVEDFEADSFVRAYDDPAGNRPKMYSSDGVELDIDWDDDDDRGFNPVRDF